MLRRIDELGRLVIPVELRKQLELNNGDEIKITSEGQRIILTNPKKTDLKEFILKKIEENLGEEGSKEAYQIYSELLEKLEE